jgi:hypothetical protein
VQLFLQNTSRDVVRLKICGASDTCSDGRFVKKKDIEKQVSSIRNMTQHFENWICVTTRFILETETV